MPSHAHYSRALTGGYRICQGSRQGRRVCLKMAAMKITPVDVTDLSRHHDLLILCARIDFGP